MDPEIADSQDDSLAESSTSEQADSSSASDGGLGTVLTPKASGSCSNCRHTSNSRANCSNAWMQMMRLADQHMQNLS